MEKAVNGTSQPATTTLHASDASSNSGEVGPLSVLPIVVSLLAVVAIAIAACVFYRKRQRQRAEVLARQLRVTERRIDAVGSLREKRERISGRKTVYYPPTDVRASASEPSIMSRPIPGARPHYVLRAYHHHRPIQTKRQIQTSLVNSTACSCDYGAEPAFCAPCKERDENQRARIDASVGSLAVELATVPSLGSLLALNTPSRPPREDCLGHHQPVRRTRSETMAVTSHTASLPGVDSRDDNDGVATASRHVLEWMEKSRTRYVTITTTHPPPPSTITAHLAPSSYPRPEEMSTTTNEQDPPPNTPVSQSVGTSVDEAVTQRTLGYISEDAQSEKWV